MNEPESKSGAPQLIGIAAQILSGLLASGNYTDIEIIDKASGYGKTEQPLVRPEAVPTAVELAVKLEAALKTIGRQ